MDHAGTPRGKFAEFEFSFPTLVGIELYNRK
ncbi:MAG: hypothetical protein BWY63_02520 [Chloroflexi bacterium ADurb.Bin360]|jgi:hypothetical protein|nr:MAG: hypothetical protein BWY63_02520 [Chloroflexi bacterium ADurb.Bin360]